MIEPGFCQCGCGKRTGISPTTNQSMGYVAGQPYRFLAGHGRWAHSLESRLWSRIDKRGPNECWTWHGAHTSAGYGVISRNGTMTTAHRVVYELIYGPIPENQIVCHACDNPSCCNPSHLWLGTDADNSNDKIAKGREGHPDNRGKRNPHAHLTEEDVISIRASYAQGSTFLQLSNKYGVQKYAIWKIVTRRAWAHI